MQATFQPSCLYIAMTSNNQLFLGSTTLNRFYFPNTQPTSYDIYQSSFTKDSYSLFLLFLGSLLHVIPRTLRLYC